MSCTPLEEVVRPLSAEQVTRPPCLMSSAKFQVAVNFHSVVNKLHIPSACDVYSN